MKKKTPKASPQKDALETSLKAYLTALSVLQIAESSAPGTQAEIDSAKSLFTHLVDLQMQDYIKSYGQEELAKFIDVEPAPNV